MIPEKWKANEKQLKSGWKHNPEILAEIVTYINDEIYVPDEDKEMENIDIALQYLDKNYFIFDSLHNESNNTWINIKKDKPKLGQKVLIKKQYVDGEIEYNVAIYAINGNDKRKRGFFQNYDSQLENENIMKYNSWEYTNVIEWMSIPN